jgi:hypothetical protein
VIFLARRDDVDAVLRQWKELGASEFGSRFGRGHDQPFLTLAMEMQRFNPFTLSPSFNCRGIGELISGNVRIWHSHFPVPVEVNSFERSWPVRRFVQGRRVPFNRPRVFPPDWRGRLQGA